MLLTKTGYCSRLYGSYGDKEVLADGMRALEKVFLAMQYSVGYSQLTYLYSKVPIIRTVRRANTLCQFY